MFGPRTFRTLLFGLRDTEENVRAYLFPNIYLLILNNRATAATLKKNFTAQSVINTFR